MSLPRAYLRFAQMTRNSLKNEFDVQYEVRSELRYEIRNLLKSGAASVEAIAKDVENTATMLAQSVYQAPYNETTGNYTVSIPSEAINREQGKMTQLEFLTAEEVIEKFNKGETGEMEQAVGRSCKIKDSS
jgi:di/tripeptidase